MDMTKKEKVKLAVGYVVVMLLIFVAAIWL